MILESNNSENEIKAFVEADLANKYSEIQKIS